MPFEEIHVMDQRQRFVHDAHAQLKTFSDLCPDYGISRKTGYKWLERWITEGPDGLHDRTSRPRTLPWLRRRTWWTHPRGSEAIHGLWAEEGGVAPGTDPAGSGAVFTYDDPQHPAAAWSGAPAHTARSTSAPRPPMTEALSPNAIWTMDFKGQFRTRDGCYCYPLTVQDMHTRFLLACHGLPDVSIAAVRPVFTRLFREFGLPERIRSDNGAPFASNELGRLSQLSVWFVTLGIAPELIEPASPYQNGKHENMHLVLKRQATRPPRANLRAQ